MIEIREARANDVAAIRDVFHACYGSDYTYPQFYDLDGLTRMVYSENQVLIVAEDTNRGQIVGTASVILEVGAFADLVGEFGRLAVLPECRNGGVGRLLMGERLRLVRDRLHVGIVDARTAHPYSLKIAEVHGFAPVGLLPLLMQLRKPESLCLLVQHFGDALSLRRNHPRVIPEVYPLGELALAHCGVPCDLIVDDDATAYHDSGGLTLREMTADGYSTLLRIERGRIRHREIFGPLRLHYGLFKLQAQRSHYYVALDGHSIVGAVGWYENRVDRAIRVFELLALDDRVTRFLLESLERACREGGRVQFVEIDVKADAPRMQRTLLELGFFPAAYIPAMVFSEVERLDIVKMVRLLGVSDLTTDDLMLSGRAKEVADLVLAPVLSRRVLPQIEDAVGRLALFHGLDDEQVRRLANGCRVVRFNPGDLIIEEGGSDAAFYLLLHGRVEVRREGLAIGTVTAGECLGEMSLLTGQPHSATAVATMPTETASLSHRDLESLVRFRPDIGVVLFRNVARGLGAKLTRARLVDAQIVTQ
jgi:CRP-like cAMP-binding protein/GNAT superfamily N-acetyltransferase